MVNLTFGGPNGLTQGFNWVFLLELIVVVIVVLFLLFFFNRVFGFVVSYIIRTYAWHRHKAYIHIEAIQLSFLAGRILFKNFRYQSRNQSVYILKGHITWRYWLRKVRVRENDRIKHGSNSELPCRVFLEVEGLEWFIYNRTPAYDAIITAAEGNTAARDSQESNGAQMRSSGERTSDDSLKQTESTTPCNPNAKVDADESSFLLNLLPVQVVGKKGAIFLGNTTTPSIVVAQFVQADLAADAAESRSKFDLYKMTYNCTFTRPTVQIKTNIDYKETLLARASHVVEKAEATVTNRTVPSLWQTVRDLIPFFQESTESLARPQTPKSDLNSNEKHWTGLPRYANPAAEDSSGVEEAEIDPLLQPTDVTEYAKVTTILDAAELQLVFYYDEPGRVPPLHKQLPSDEEHIGNGDLSPEWGMDIEVSGATISYGPWADRQRACLQEMFFPGSYEDAKVASTLKVGDQRVYAYFKLQVEFKDSVTFKVPTKEKSKDWKYSAQYLRSSIDQRVTTRSFAWIELKASAESTITYHMGLTPRHDGWTNFLNLELKQLRVTTSINYGMFTEAEGVRIQCDLANPLKWDALHNWAFNVTVFRPQIFLLRDHITLFSDCGADWTSAPTDYATWIPYIYTLNFNLVDFSLFLNVNDGNIISSPAHLNDNSYITFRGAKMSGKAIIPSDKISPVEHIIQFEAQCPTIAMTVHAPLWNTLSVLLSQQEVGQLHKLELVGSYTYPSDVSRNNIETLDMQVSASYVSVIFYGFLLRYFFNVRNNYFGDHTQFVTLEEYQREAKLPGQDSMHVAGKRPPVSNVLDVIIAVEVSMGAMILPSRLYEVSEGVRMHFDMLQADVRFMDYYMVNMTPISCFHHLKEPMDEIFEDIGDKVPQAFVDGVTVHAHRLLGIPPSNPAYICNWDFDVGLITGQVKIPFLQAINSALDSFVYNLVDVENALTELSPPDRDITFLRVNAAGASMRIPVDTEEIRIQLGPTTIGADDRTSLLRSSRATISIQSFSVQIVHIAKTEKMVASFHTALRMTLLGRRQDLLDHGPKQAKHVRDNDEPSRRAWFLYSKKRGHAQEDLDTFEIDLPVLAAERVSTLHSQTYTSKCTLPKGGREEQEIHLASSFLAPDYRLSLAGGDDPQRPTTPEFRERTPMLHSSYGDVMLTHVDGLPSAQKTFIVEVSVDTTLLLTPDVIHSATVMLQALETTDTVASLDEFQLETVHELLAVKHDRSTVMFAEVLLPRMRICLQGDDGLGLLVDIADLTPQFRSVHYKDIRAEGATTEPQESSVSIIAGLRAADATVYRHDSQTLEIPDISSQRKDLAHISLQNLDVKVRQGSRIFGSVSLGDIEGSINAHEMTSIAKSVQQWLSHINVLSSTMQTISQQRLCKSRNLVAAIVIAGDNHGIGNDPGFLTRPSHVLRISKNLLRVDDSWKISVRVRHISRSLPPEVKDEIDKQFTTSTTCALDSMGPVTKILSKWRSWEMSNIQESFFVKWLYGVHDGKVKAADVPIEGVVALKKVVLYFDARDGKENALTLAKAVVSYNEHPQTPSEATLAGVEVDCENMTVNTSTNALDLMDTLNRQREAIEEVKDITKGMATTNDVSTMQYRATIHLNQADLSAQIASLAVASAVHDLRASGFSRLRNDEPSICLSFQQAGLAILEDPNVQQYATHLNLKRFTGQMISSSERPGIAASLGSLSLRLPRSIPWLVTKLSETAFAIQKNLNISPDTSVRSAFEKPNIPTVAFRLHQASIEGWLVPDVLQINLDSGGFQAVLGELSDDKQWGFFDVPPATVSFHRVGEEKVKFAEIETPFIAAKARIQWSEGLCKVDPDVQVGTLSVSLTSLVTLFQSLASEEVINHTTECQKAIEYAQSLLSEPEPPQSDQIRQPIPFISYRVHTLWEAIEVKADTPDAKLLFACTGIKMSLSNRSVKKSSEHQRILFAAASQSTSISLFTTEDPNEKVSVMDMHWETGNSIKPDNNGNVQYRLHLISNGFLITLSPRSISQASRALRHIVQEVESLRIRQTLTDLDIGPKRPRSKGNDGTGDPVDESAEPLVMLEDLDAVRVSFSNVQFKWLADDRFADSQGFTFKCKTVDASVLERATRGRFVIQEGELELNCRKTKISSNYARLPKLDFNVHRRTEADGWALQLDAHGDMVQVNFTPACVETGRAVLESISSAAASLRTDFPSDNNATNPLSSHALLQAQKLKEVITSIDFRGARINAQYDKGFKPTGYMSKYKVQGDGCNVGAMRVPGLSLRSRFSRKPRHVFHAEICILESSNVLSPQIKPFLHEILHRIERVMSRRTVNLNETSSQSAPETVPSTATILGDLKFSVGLRVQSQELTLTCDPFAKVDASIGVDEIYATLISCKTENHNQTFAMTLTVSGAHASLQHHYSGIASAKIKLNDLNLSMFNNNQIRTTEPGLSAILKSSALEVSLNARQGQDFLIFNSLWLEGPPADSAEEMREKRLSNPISMQQLQKVTASPPSFPINITVLMDKINFALDLGQSIGTTDLEVRGVRISNRKCSEYHHCIFVNMDSAEAESRGRFSGYMKANKFLVQTSIYFQAISDHVVTTPLVQIDVKLGYVEFRAAFEYHEFLIGDSTTLRFTIFNRRIHHTERAEWSDRLVFVGDSELVQLYATAEGPSLVLALYKAVNQLQEEKEQARTKELASFKEVGTLQVVSQSRPSEDVSLWHNTISASRVDMEMSIKFAKINIGIFKAALNDSPVFRVNVANIRALFSQTVSNGALENQLDLALGTLGIALSPLRRMSGKELGEMKVEKWIKHVSSMRGGVILAVPETEGSMWTKQDEESDTVEHIFKSRLDGKVDIGWNYGSVMYVQELWKTFELKLKQSEETRVTGLSKAEEQIVADQVQAEAVTEQGVEIPPEVRPVSRGRTYSYVALEPAIVETPQLRQMGDATPPMEWIGVNRMRLPAFTHQAFIVPLQKVSRKVETLYNLALGGGTY